MFKTKEEKEILEFLKENRNAIDQIAEFIYHNGGHCNGSSLFNLSPITMNSARIGVCRQLGIMPESKASIILGELIRLYSQQQGIKSDDFTPKYWHAKDESK